MQLVCGEALKSSRYVEMCFSENCDLMEEEEPRYTGDNFAEKKKGI